MISLLKCSSEDVNEIYSMQIKSFAQLLEKYKDYEFSPGAEKIERTVQHMCENVTTFYFIVIHNKRIGVIRICDFGELVKLKQIFILPEYQGFSYAQAAIIEVEKLYPEAKRWELDTIKQEEKLCYLYEKMGYSRTGKYQNIKEDMDIVFYAKCT